MSTLQRDGLASESTEDREARLRRMGTRQHEQQEEERVCQPVTKEREPLSHLGTQSSVQATMRTFHGPFANLTSPRYSIILCSESFPGLQLRPTSTECVHCFRDNRIPKLYSSAVHVFFFPNHLFIRLLLYHIS